MKNLAMQPFTYFNVYYNQYEIEATHCSVYM